MNSFQLIITYLKFSILFVFEYPFYIDCLFTIYAVALHLFVVPTHIPHPDSPHPPLGPPAILSGGEGERGGGGRWWASLHITQRGVRTEIVSHI